MKKFILILIFGLVAFVPCLGQSVLTSEERQSLAGNSYFTEKCQWAIRDYASYWYIHDGTGLNTADRAKWREEFVFVKSVNRAEYSDSNLALRFVILSKGMQFNVDADPTSEEIIALFVANNKFDELASMYFALISE